MTLPDKPLPGPQPNPETQAFWDGVARGELLLRRCHACDRAHWYPRAICPHCASDRTGWARASGAARLYSYSLTRRVAEPYVIAYVTLEEGPTMLTNVVGCDVDSLRVGMELRVTFAPTENGLAVPVFTPA